MKLKQGRARREFKVWLLLDYVSPISPIGSIVETMKPATVTIPDDLAEPVESFVRAQEVPPPLTAVVQAALRQYLTGRGYLRARGPLRINPARRGSGRRDVSRAHDSYLVTPCDSFIHYTSPVLTGAQGDST